MLLPIILIILSIAAFACYTGRFTSIDLSYSYKQQSFYERYRDLINGIVYVLFGAIIGWLLKP
jgi:hypothetical protein